MAQSVEARTATRRLPMLRRLRRLAPGLDVRWAIVTVVLSSAGAAWTLRLWRGDLRVPFSYENDGQLYALLVKEVVTRGWYLTNPLLGVPFGSQLLDFPLGGDNLHFLVIKALGLTSSDWALVMNLFYLLCFPLVALSAFVAMRRLRVSAPAAAACATLFALAPYHFWQGEFHLMLAAYYTVPLSCYLIIVVCRGEPLFRRRLGQARGPLAWASRRSVATLAMCALIASADTYYVIFTALLLAIGAAAGAVSRRDALPLRHAALAITTIVTGLALNVSPSIVWRVEHGSDPDAMRRSVTQSDQGSLSVAGLVLPVSGHRVGVLAGIARRYHGGPVRPEFSYAEADSAPLGVVATAGFAALMLLLAAAALGAGERWDPGGRLRPAAVVALACLLLAAGGGTVLASVVTPTVRQWTRLSIFIAFLSLLAVGVLLDRIRSRFGPRRAGRAAWLVLLAAIVVVGTIDQSSRLFVPQYRRLAAAYHSDQAFFGAIERRLPRGSAVLQMPYMPWPEPGAINLMTSYAGVRGYLHSRALRWSYGGMLGRPADWESQLDRQPVEVVAAAGAATGFSGVYIDRFGYAGRTDRQLERQLDRLVGTPPMVSRDHRMSFFDLRGYARRLRASMPPQAWRALAAAALHPVRLDPGAGTLAAPKEDFPTRGLGVYGRVTIRRRGELDAVGPSGGSRLVTFSASVSAATPTPAIVVFPGGRSERLTVGARPIAICRRLRVRRTRAIAFVAVSSALHIDHARVVDAAYYPFVGEPLRCGP